MRTTLALSMAPFFFAAGCITEPEPADGVASEAVSGTQAFEAAPIEYERDARIKFISKSFRFPLADGSELVAIDQGGVAFDGKGGQVGFPLIVKYTSTGRIDRKFGDKGIVVESTRARLRGAILQSGNRLVVLYTESLGGDGAPLLKQYSAEGTPVATFGKNGAVVDPGGDAELSEAYAIAKIAKDGFAVAFRSGSYLFRSSGALDETMGKIGKLDSYFKRMLVDGKGRMLALSEGFISRYLPNGAPDISFGKSGVLHLSDVDLADATVDAKGRIVAVAEHDGLVYRLDESGKPDTTFGTAGVLKVSWSKLENTHSVVVDGLGRIWLSGDVNSAGFFSGDPKWNIGILRVLNDGKLDPSFDGDGKLQVDVSRQETYAALSIESGKVVLRGTFDNNALYKGRFR